MRIWFAILLLILRTTAFATVHAQPASQSVLRQRFVGVHMQPEQARELGRLLGTPYSVNYAGTSETITLANNVYLKIINASGVANNTLKLDNSNNLLYNTAGGEHLFYTNGTLRVAIDDAAPNLFFTGTVNTSAHIFTSTADGADHMSISMSASGAQGTDRGGIVTCYGNEFTTSNRQGECRVIGAAVSGADVTIESHHADADVILDTVGGAWRVDATNGYLKSNTTSACVVLKSPDGTCACCGIDNSDVFSCTSTAC